MRYASSIAEAFGWLLHDTVVHVATGMIGFAGKLVSLVPGTGSTGLRLITVAHHIHNATAPSNDVLSDHAHAMALACHNELYPGHVQSQDETLHNFEQAWKLGWRPKGDGSASTDRDMHAFLKGKGVKPWQTAIEDNYESPKLVSVEEAEDQKPANIAAIALEEAQQNLDEFLARKITPRQWKQMPDSEKAALRDEMVTLESKVEVARRAVGAVNKGTTLKDVLKDGNDDKEVIAMATNRKTKVKPGKPGKR